LNCNKYYNRFSRIMYLIIISLTVTAVTSCLTTSAYKQAIRYQEAGAYDQAVEKYQEALASEELKGEDRAKIEKDFSALKIVAAKRYFRKATAYSKKNKTQAAVKMLEKAVAFDPKNSDYAIKLEEEQNKLGDIKSKINASMAKGEKQHQWDTAIEEMESYQIYESSFPGIADKVKSLKLKASRYYVGRSDEMLNHKKYEMAYEKINKANKYSSEQDIIRKKNARHHLFMSKVAWKNKKYMKAYEEIQKGLEFEPNHPALKEYQDRFLSEWAGFLYNEAVSANNNGDYATAKRRLLELSRFKPGFLNTEEMLDEIQSTMASTYYEKAQRILDNNDRSKIGTALTYFLLVKQEHSMLFHDIDDKIMQAKKMLRRELEHRISLEFDNRSDEPGAANMVREQILSKIKNSKRLKHITILDRESIDDILREQGLGQGFLDESTAIEVKKIKGIQAGVRGEVIKFSVKETGRDRPSYGSAKYKSGKRWVPNPDYTTAQADVQAAQQRVFAAQQSANDTQRQQNQIMKQQQRINTNNNPLGALSAGLGQLSTSLAAGQVKKAKNDLADAQSRLVRTPQQIEEDIESNYRYEIFDLKLHGEVVLSFKIINYTTSEIGEVHTVRKEEILEDRYIPGDPGKNVKSDPISFPSQDELKNKLLQEAVNELFDNMIQELNRSSKDYYRIAKSAAEDNITDEAIENYMRYIYSAPNLGDQHVQAANDYIYDCLGIQVIRRKR